MVVKYIEKDAAKALENDKMCKDDGPSPDGWDFRETFARWFRVEIRRLSADRCDKDMLYGIKYDTDIIEQIRHTREGIPVGRILEGRAKLMFRIMSCLHP